MVPLGEAHVRQLVHEFVEHYHHERNHQGRDNQLLQRPPPPVNPDPTLSGGSASADFSASTTERPHEGAADYLHLTGFQLQQWTARRPMSGPQRGTARWQARARSCAK